MLPKGWQRSTLGECAELLTGYAFSSQDYAPENTSAVRLLRGDNVMQGTLRWEDAKYWALPYDKVLERYEMQSGDIVIAMDRPITNAGLKCSSVKESDLPCLLVQRVARMRAKENFEQEYLAQVLQTHNFMQHLKGQKTETAVPHISPNDLRDFAISFPEKAEQRRIANVLSTWDQAIVTTERLLANSQRQKQILIGSLISDRKAARENQSNWEQSTLCQVATVAVSSVNKKSESGERAVQLCNYTDVYYRDYIDSRIAFMQATASDNEIEKFTLRSGDVIITKDSETAADIAVAARVTETVPNLVCGYHLAMIRPDLNRIDPVFLHSYFNLPRTKDYFASNANGVTRFGLPLGAIQDAPIAFPFIDEQRKIGQIISSAELEVAGLVKDIELLKIQKLALMAQLLTGKRRVRLTTDDGVSP
jgi:type I restriction enzyme, S subunit